MSTMRTLVSAIAAAAVELLVDRDGAESRPAVDERPERGRVHTI